MSKMTKGKANRSFLMILFVLLFTVVATVGFAGGSPATEQYPSRPVDLVVPFAPGGNSDVLARAIDTVIGNYFPEPLVISNRPGAGGTTGVTYALGQKPDGYTLLISSWGAFVTQPHLNELEYEESDYNPVMQIGFTSRVIMAHPSVPYNSLKELIDFAQANPEEVRVGITAVGATDHLAWAQLELDNNVKFNLVPQDGSGGARVAILGNHVDVVALDVNVGSELVLAGEVKGFAVTAEERYPMFPNIPTATELGYPVISGVATHLYVPAGTPEDRIRVIHDAFKSATENPEFVEMAERSQFNIEYRNSADSRTQLSSMSRQYRTIIEALGMGATN